MRIAVFGAGGVGAFFGARLVRAGHEVVFVARGKQLEAITAHGITIDSPRDPFEVGPVVASADPAEFGGAVDAVLLCVKAWQVRESARAVRPLLGTDTPVLPLQNGIDAPDELAEELGAGHALAGLARVICYLTGPGRVFDVGFPPQITFGELTNERTERVDRLAEAIELAGIKPIVPDDIRVELWRKFAFITATSGVGAVARLPLGDLRSNPETRELMRRCLDEIRAVGLAVGVAIPADLTDTTLAFIDTLPDDGTMSMQRDLMEGRPSELEQQTGAVVRLGREHGIETPANGFVYDSQIALERKARS